MNLHAIIFYHETNTIFQEWQQKKSSSDTFRLNFQSNVWRRCDISVKSSVILYFFDILSLCVWLCNVSACVRWRENERWMRQACAAVTDGRTWSVTLYSHGSINNNQQRAREIERERERDEELNHKMNAMWNDADYIHVIRTRSDLADRHI